MKSQDLPVYEKLKKKYHHTEEVTNFKDMIYRSADIYRSRTAFKCKDKNGNIYPITYADFLKDIKSLGTALLNMNLANKKIAVIGNNSYMWSTSYLAASIVGIVVPLDKELPSDDIINFLNVAECSAIVADKKQIDKILPKKEMLINKDTIFIHMQAKEDTPNYLSYDKQKEGGNNLLANGNQDFDNISVDPDEMKILLFTSGTTGKAKGVCLSHRNICSNILSTYGIVKVKRSDVFFSVLPIHHTYECTLGFLLPIYSGACIVYCDGLRYISKNMNEYHPTVILSVPLLLENVYKKIIKSLNESLPKKYVSENGKNPFPKLPFYLKPIVKSKIKNSLGGRLRVFIVGAASTNPEIVHDFDLLGLRTLQGYGLTECSPLVAGNTDYFSKDDSAGLPIPNVEYKIEEPNDEGIGEIIVKGPNVMLRLL